MRSLLSEEEEKKIAGVPITGVILPVLFLIAMWTIITIAAIRDFQEDPHPCRDDKPETTISTDYYIQ